MFYVFHLPILLLLVGIFALSTFISSRVTSTISSESAPLEGSVLSSGSSKDDSDDSSDDDEDEDENEDEDEKDDDNGEDSNDDDDNDSDDESDDEDEEENEFEDEVEDESDDDNKSSGSASKSEVKVQNADGTFSIVKTEEEDGKLKKEIKTYDASGNKIRVEKYESEEGEEKSRVSAYDGLGNKISDIRLETEDGKELELRVKEGETELSRIKFDIEKQELIVRSDDSVFDTNESEDESDENKLRIRLDGNNFLLTRNGANALSKFPLVVDDATGTVFVQTPNGEIRLGVMPDTIIEKAEASDDVDSVSDVALEVDGADSASLEFKMAGTKSQKLLGVFTLQIPSTVVYDAKTGEFLRNDKTFATKLLDLFSF